MKNITIAAALALATFATGAFAATRNGVPVSQGAAYDQCHQQLYPQGGADDHHKGPVIRACVERVMHGGSAL